MSKVFFACVDNIFKSYDYNNIPIKNAILKKHNKRDNAWISLNKNVYSIRKDDEELLKLFYNFYGKNVNDFFYNNNFIISIKEKIIILEKLKKRKIGILID